MPTYPYKCEAGHDWDVIKRVAEMRDPENCPECGELGKRYISRTYFYGASDWDNAEYCPALGQNVRSNKHRQQLARERGLEEVGNENMDKIAKEYRRDVEKEKEKGYEEAAKLAYNEGFRQ